MIEARREVALRPASRRATARRYLPVGLLGLDLALAYTAFILAYWIRYSLKLGPAIHEQISFSAYQPVVLLLLGVLMPVLLVKGAYRLRMSTEMVDEAVTVFSGVTITVAAIVVITAMLQRYVYSRGVIVYLWLLLIGLLVIGRALFRWLQGALYRRGWGTERVLVVGGTDAGMMVMQSIMNRPDLGYQLAGFVHHVGGPEVHDFGRFRALGTVKDVPALIEAGDIDHLIIALPASAHEDVWPILLLCEQHGVGLKLIPDLFEMSLSRVRVDDIAGIPLLDVREQPLHVLARGLKRLLDIGVALILSVATLPIVLVLAVLIRLESPGQPVIRQRRVGLSGVEFDCFKLRTMRCGADELKQLLGPHNEASGPLFKMRDDPRRTRVGARIRRWSVDEIPQFWNVLLGDMSLVGPRPPLPAEVATYEERHLRRLEMKPGMTGVWQVSGRSNLPFEEMVMMDIYYIDNWSLALDLKIIVRTVVAVLGRHGAY